MVAELNDRWSWKKFAGAAIHKRNIPRELYTNDRGHIPSGEFLSHVPFVYHDCRKFSKQTFVPDSNVL